MATLSVCMIVKDEENNLTELLPSIEKFADEIVVVDTGSTDNSLSIAKKFGAKTGTFEWCDDFSKARNRSLELAECEYVMWLDADDRIEDGEARKITQLKEQLSPNSPKAFMFKIKSLFTNSRSDVCYQVRLFPNREDLRFKGRVHEQIVWAITKAEIPLAITEVEITHTGYENPIGNRKKLLRNLKLLLEDLKENPHDPAVNHFTAKTYLGLGDTKKAKEYLYKTLTEEYKSTNAPSYIEAAIMLANIHLQEHDPNRAKELLHNLLKNFPKNDIVKLALAEVLARCGEYRKALGYLEEIRTDGLNLITIPIDQGSITSKYYELLGICHEAIGNTQLAINFYKLSAKFNPHSKSPWERMGILHAKKGDSMKAIEAFKYTLPEEVKEPAASIIAKSRLLVEQGKRKEAIKTLKESITLHPNNPYLLEILANLLADEGNLEEAKNILRKTTELQMSKTNNVKINTLIRMALCQAHTLDIEECAYTASTIIERLNMKVNKTINSIIDLAEIYIDIGKFLKDLGNSGASKLSINTAKALLNLQALANITRT